MRSSTALSRSRAAWLLLLLPGLSACVVPPRGPDAAGERVGPRVADAMLRAGDATAALQVADGMLAADPQDADARLRRGRALTALGRGGEAASDFAEAARQRPADPSILEALAASRAAGGDSAATEAAWRAVLARRADAASERRARVGLAIALDLQERHAEAQALYRLVLRDRPDDATAAADLGLSLALSGHTAEALALLDRPGVGGHGSRARHDLAVVLLLAGDEARARAVLSEDLAAADVAAAIESVRALAPG